MKMNSFFIKIATATITLLTFLPLCIAQPATTAEDITDKEVVVRIYHQWRTRGRELFNLELQIYDTVTAPLNHQNFNLDSLEIPTPKTDQQVMIIVTPDDQIEKAITDYIGDCVYIEPFEKGKNFILPTMNSFDKNVYLTFNDALGKPIANASVTIFLSDSWDPLKASIKTAITDENGKIKAPAIKGKRPRIKVIFEEPDYGKFLLSLDYWSFKSKSYTIPACKAGTGYDDRLIWGTVTDEENLPIKGALIHCSSISTPGQGNIQGGITMVKVDALTDEKGLFSISMPIDEKYSFQKIPANSKYNINIKAPSKLRLLPFSGQIPCGKECNIKLKQGDFLIYPVFDDANGIITDKNILERIRIKIDALDGKKYSYYYGECRNGLKLPPGTYSADDDLYKKYDFEKITITTQPPSETIVFHMKALENNMKVSGQVKYGKDSTPVNQAFVILAGHGFPPPNNFAQITPDQWKLINELGTNPDINDAALKPLKKVWNFSEIIRTNENGQFELQVGSIGYDRSSIKIFKQGYLPIIRQLTRDTRQEQKIITQDDLLIIPDIRLYPSASVIFKPIFEQEIKNISVRWQLSDNTEVEWFDDFCEYKSQPRGPFDADRRALPNEIYYCTIPAEINIYLWLIPNGHNRKDSPWLAPIFSEIINASQGQIIDLDVLAYPSEIPVFVKVIDSSGNPLEGIAISNGETNNKLYFGQRHISDANGLAKFLVPDTFEAAFMVGWNGINTTSYQSLAYKTNGPQDTNSVFIMQINDEILKQITKPEIIEQ